MIWFTICVFVGLVGYVYYYFKVYPAQTAANQDVSEVELLFGLMKAVYWEENEAVLIGRKKKVFYDSSEHEDENEKIIFPFKGEQVLARVNSGSELLAWEDVKKTFTRDGLRVQIDVALRWKIENLKNYLYKINRPKGSEKSHYNLKGTTLEWLSKHLEATMRRLVRELTIPELISSSANKLFPNVFEENKKQRDVENIAQKVEKILRKELQPFGILIERVEISDIQFEGHVQRAIDEVRLAILEQQRSLHEGEAAMNRLKPMIQELGKEGVILIEALKNMKGSMLFPPPQLNELLSNSSPIKLKSGDEEKLIENKDEE